MVDYKELLRKYIAHVVMYEGTDCLGDRRWPEPWSEEEWAALQELPDELREPGGS